MQHRLAFEIVRAAKYAALTIISADRNLARLTRAEEPSHSVISYEVLAQAQRVGHPEPSQPLRMRHPRCGTIPLIHPVL
jgi:hypothetical protein